MKRFKINIGSRFSSKKFQIDEIESLYKLEGKDCGFAGSRIKMRIGDDTLELYLNKRQSYKVYKFLEEKI